MSINLGDLSTLTVFSDYIEKTSFNNPLDPLIKEVYNLRDRSQGNIRTNVHGWQSGNLSGIKGPLSELYNDVWNFVDRHVESTYNKRLSSDSGWWANINDKHSYNTIHHHGRTDIIALAYLKAPPDCGELCIARNDGATYTQLYNDNYLYIKPEVSTLYVLPGHLWHYVIESNASTDRISISYNFFIDQKSIYKPPTPPSFLPS